MGLSLGAGHGCLPILSLDTKLPGICSQFRLFLQMKNLYIKGHSHFRGQVRKILRELLPAWHLGPLSSVLCPLQHYILPWGQRGWGREESNSGLLHCVLLTAFHSSSRGSTGGRGQGTWVLPMAGNDSFLEMERSWDHRCGCGALLGSRSTSVLELPAQGFPSRKFRLAPLTSSRMAPYPRLPPPTCQRQDMGGTYTELEEGGQRCRMGEGGRHTLGSWPVYRTHRCTFFIRTPQLLVCPYKRTQLMLTERSPRSPVSAEFSGAAAGRGAGYGLSPSHVP